jgi:hypothetical protein
MFLQFGFSIEEFFIFYYYSKKIAFDVNLAYLLVEIDDFLRVPHLMA